MLSLFIYSLAATAVSGSAIPAQIWRRQDTGPVVTLSYGSFEGNASGNLVAFLGMPYAAPPVGNLRFAPPQPPIPFTGTNMALSYGAACPQQGNGASSPISEDCLFINVITPLNIQPGVKLPVLFWINGGAFKIGDTSVTPGHPIVDRSIDLGEPVVYVSANYRLNGFGFLGGSQMQSAGLGNIGLQDQRFAMQWVQQNIAAFGGDPTRVTISGESAGSMSVGFHLVTNGGDPAGLFHGAFMSSGSPYNIQPMSSGQEVYNQILTVTGCLLASDTIACLRGRSLSDYMTALATIPAGTLWQPYVDGIFLTENPWKSILEGNHAKVPFVTGDVDDEGTKFAEPLVAIVTNSEVQALLATNYFPGATNAQLTTIMTDYPQDPTQGSPYNTGNSNAITPQYKRLAAIIGDALFQVPRRFFLQIASQTQSTWAFLYQRDKSTPILGSYHTVDVPELYGSATANDYILTDAFINFVNTLNPSLPSNEQSLLTTSGVQWDEWSSSADAPPMLLLTDTDPNPSMITDNYRQGPMADLIAISMFIHGLSN